MEEQPTVVKEEIESQDLVFDPVEDPIVFSGNKTELDAFNRAQAAKKPPDVAGVQPATVVKEETTLVTEKSLETPPATTITPTETPVIPAETPPKEIPAAETPPATIKPQVPPPDDLVSDEEYFKLLNRETGLEVKSDEELFSSIKGLRDKSNLDPLKDMSPLLKQAYEYEKKGGNAKAFLSIIAVDTQNMSNKELLRQKFFNDNPDLLKMSSEFAGQKFEREFNEKYNILDEEKTEEDFDETVDYLKWQDNKAYAKGELEYTAKAAAQIIDTLKKDIVEKEPENPAVLSKADEEAILKSQENYTINSTKFKEEFEAIQMPLDAKGETLFNIGLNKETKPVFESWLENPGMFFEHIGVSKDGKTIDVDRFGAHVALVAALEGQGEEGIGSKLVQFVLEKFDKETILAKLEHPVPEVPAGINAGKEMTDEEEAIAKFKESTGGGYAPFYYPEKPEVKK